MHRVSLLVALLPALVIACGGRAPAYPQQVLRNLTMEVLAEGLIFPASVNFAPDGRVFILERGGLEGDKIIPARLNRLDLETGELESIEGMPETHLHRIGEETVNGGALGLELDPEFANNGRLYLCYHYRRIADRGDELFENRLSRFTLEGSRLVDETVLVDRVPGNENHNGCRVVVGPEGHVFYSTGVGARERTAMRVDKLTGKVLRLHKDGSIPTDNPFSDSPVWSYGHRNPQGLAFEPATGALWSTDHGSNSNDELNRIEKGMHYGYLVCDGEAAVGETYLIGRRGRQRVCRMEEELATNYRPAARAFNPTVGISDIAFYDGEPFAEWQGQLLLTTLKAGQLLRLVVDRARVVEQHDIIAGGDTEFVGRLRDVAVGPDGLIYVLTNVTNPPTVPATGQLVRLRPH